ncbi:hypothetical protein B0H13DRAFT_1628024 [Mycena leptocephala]|nr:hypothetical protein B0H13DRAFT_1628024 [Mycena leptocephala]
MHNLDDLDLAIAGDQDHHIRHAAIDVVENQCPFNSKDATAIFCQALEDVKSAGIISKHFGVAEAEWEEPFYGETENVKVGRKDVEIVLPFEVWYPHAVAWAQGLELMVHIQAAENGEIIT